MGLLDEQALLGRGGDVDLVSQTVADQVHVEDDLALADDLLAPQVSDQGVLVEVHSASVIWRWGEGPAATMSSTWRSAW